jgi:hypothetical protein
MISPREVYTDIRINAPAETVWNILTDLGSYREWNPFIVKSVGKAELGERLTCRPRISKTRIATFHPVVTRLKPGTVFVWTGHFGVPGLADGVHIFELKAENSGETLLIHRQTFSGILMPLIWKPIEKVAIRGFTRMNEALKERAEALSGQ